MPTMTKTQTAAFGSNLRRPMPNSDQSSSQTYRNNRPSGRPAAPGGGGANIHPTMGSAPMSPAPSASEEVDGAYSAGPSALLQQTPLSAVGPAAAAGLVRPSDSSRQIHLCLESSTIKRKGSEEEVPGTIYRTKGRAAAAAVEPSGGSPDRQRHQSNDEDKERIIRIEENRRMTRGVDSSLQTIENNQRRSSKELVMGQGSQRMKMSKTRLEESHNEDIKNPIQAAATTTSRRSPPRSPYPAR